LVGAEGAWEVDHSKARANSGIDHKNNLYPVCIGCNRRKKAHEIRPIQEENVFRGPPMPAKMKEGIRQRNTLGTAIISGVKGILLGGPVVLVAALVFGGCEGILEDQEKRRKIR
jgi:hypothetical protein